MSRNTARESGIDLVLHKWQSECLDLWAQNGYRGIVNAVTGSGKTVLAMAAVRQLEAITDKELRVKIIVPQTFLAFQWKDEVKRQLDAQTADIGIYYGKRKDSCRKYMVYVINSARYSLARHIMSDIGNGCAVLLIADECHHYGSMENNRVFDFYKHIGSNAAYYALGLSATPEIVNFKAISTPLGREIFCYGFGRAIQERIISRFILYSVRLDFTLKERMQYESLSTSLGKCIAQLNNEYPKLNGLSSGAFFANLQSLAQQGCEEAQAALSLIYRRRTLSHMASERSVCAALIVKELPQRTRIILFCERIQAAEQLYGTLREQYPGQVGLYHSRMADNARQAMLKQYKHGALRILICCKALDEGLNIPSTEAGIIVSSSMSARQRVQRLGRVLRRSKEIKRIYYQYIGDSREDSELVQGLRTLEHSVPYISLRYHKSEFFHQEYERLRKSVLKYVELRRNDPELLRALNKNISRALLRGDFLLNEQACWENLNNSRSITERNYWKSVLYVVLARLDKL